ncbi:MAG: multicopper oxidase family protein, partial [Betaproteobacteria bacterium]|nr:multicopper oxidase family protein [Betaproteobacteria bacterium]
TQAPILPGSTFAVRYAAIDAGTYWYHPHQSSFEQVPRGLYGMLVVEEAKPPRVDRELERVLADLLDKANRQVEDFGRVRFRFRGPPGQRGDLNGTATGANRAIDMRPGERVRIRLLNAASARAFVLEFGGLAPWIVTYDGQAVQPHPIPDGRLLLGAGQRTDLVIDVPDAAGKRFLVTDQRRGGEAIVALACAGRPVRAKAPGAPRPSPRTGWRSPTSARRRTTTSCSKAASAASRPSAAWTERR